MNTAVTTRPTRRSPGLRTFHPPSNWLRKPAFLQNVPGFVRGHAFQALQHRVGHLRASVRKAVAVPLRGERDALFIGKQAKLSVGGN